MRSCLRRISGPSTSCAGSRSPPAGSAAGSGSRGRATSCAPSSNWPAWTHFCSTGSAESNRTKGIYDDRDEHADRRAGARRSRSPPPSADRLLLPDARLGCRGRRCRPGDHGQGMAGGRPLRRPLQRAIVALPHRHERVHRHGSKPPAASPADGHRPGPDPRRRPSVRRPARRPVDHPGRRRARHRPARRSRRRRRGPGHHPPRLRVGPATSPGPAAGRPGAVRCPALARHRRRRAARHLGTRRQQRAPTSPSHHGRVRTRVHRRPARSPTPRSDCWPGTWRPSSATTWTR